MNRLYSAIAALAFAFTASTFAADNITSPPSITKEYKVKTTYSLEQPSIPFKSIIASETGTDNDDIGWLIKTHLPPKPKYSIPFSGLSTEEVEHEDSPSLFGRYSLYSIPFSGLSTEEVEHDDSASLFGRYSVKSTRPETMGDHIFSLSSTAEEDDGTFKGLAATMKTTTSLMSTYSTTPVTIGFGMIDSPVCTEEDDGYFKTLAGMKSTSGPVTSAYMTTPVTIGFGMIDSPVCSEEDDGYFKNLAGYSFKSTQPTTIESVFKSLAIPLKSKPVTKVESVGEHIKNLPDLKEEDLDTLLYKY
ncbi:hypothetical protein KY328_04665 [Candidatus Woesearchaeota archaeon]|nr:hypothetical protein [Candidatus Woesearchaeota archaeon]